jgi:hypothetical protein
MENQRWVFQASFVIWEFGIRYLSAAASAHDINKFPKES